MASRKTQGGIPFPLKHTEGRVSWRGQDGGWDCSSPSSPLAHFQQWQLWPLLSCYLVPCLITPPGESCPGNSERELCLFSLEQVPLSSAKHQDRSNSEGPWGYGQDSYFPPERKPSRQIRTPHPQAAFLLRMARQKKGAPFIARFPHPHSEHQKLNVSG